MLYLTNRYNYYKFINSKERRNVKNEAYDKLEYIFDIIPNSCIKILIVDLNLKFKKEDIYIPTFGLNSLCDVTTNIIKN